MGKEALSLVVLDLSAERLPSGIGGKSDGAENAQDLLGDLRTVLFAIEGVL